MPTTLTGHQWLEHVIEFARRDFYNSGATGRVLDMLEQHADTCQFATPELRKLLRFQSKHDNFDGFVGVLADLKPHLG